MARGSKVRRIDYSQNELCEMLGIKRQQFVPIFKKFCQRYGFNISDFKKGNDENADYMFAIDWTELLVLLLKTIRANPLYRENSSSNVTATNVTNYFSDIDDCIEDDDFEYFRNLIISLPVHYDMKLVKEFTPLFVDKLAEFIAHTTKLKNEEFGSTLKEMYKQIDRAMYNQFRANRVWNIASENNINHQVDANKMSQDEIVAFMLSKEMQRKNISIDKAVALMLKLLMLDTSELYKQIGKAEYLDSKNPEIVKILLHGIKSPSVNMERQMFHRIETKNLSDDFQVQMAESVLDNFEKNKARWKRTIVDRIEDNEKLWYEKSLIEKKEILENEKMLIEEQLSAINEAIESKEKTGVDAFEDEIKRAYLRHCEEVKKESEKYRNVSDLLVGQVLAQFLEG